MWIIQAYHRTSPELEGRWIKTSNVPENLLGLYAKMEYTLEEAIQILTLNWNHRDWHFRLFNNDTFEVIPYEAL